MRKLADLYFMFKMYKSAYGFYHTAKKDFQSDEAWNYYAGAAEMSALAQYMQVQVHHYFIYFYLRRSLRSNAGIGAGYLVSFYESSNIAPSS